ncbi:glycerate kinase [Arundinibacter roseus]|uniref:Glycerate kinase n=1 Tax=Arundinibacter roseus TaxID=2070510 RepID=A0A4R4KF90_9BACT|nr:glycerate kinase [Arundinibacter roseus]TDB65139.1 glycerate kinase [Arundinibacter roseus]
MKIVVAPDKFRGSLEADEVCKAMKEGILGAFPDAEVLSVPLADGGEGTAKALTLQAKGEFITIPVFDPLGRPIDATYGLSPDHSTAFIEMASASGLWLLDLDERDPTQTTSYGTGQLIADALRRGVKKIILGIGGSATNDAGIGMAAALGYRFLNSTGQELPPNGENLINIHSIDCANANPCLDYAKITVACDVTNPLYGHEGASYVYAPQKGATMEKIQLLDKGLFILAKIATKTFGFDVSQEPGSGAAGGVGAGARWFLNATLQPGASIVLTQTRIEDYIKEADLVITGEGKMDKQTLQGKLVKGLAEICQKYEVPVAAVCGTLAISSEDIKKVGLSFAMSAINRPMSLEQAQKETFPLVREATFQLVSLFFHHKKMIKE